jgi:hypothetical protein
MSARAHVHKSRLRLCVLPQELWAVSLRRLDRSQLLIKLRNVVRRAMGSLGSGREGPTTAHMPPHQALRSTPGAGSKQNCFVLDPLADVLNRMAQSCCGHDMDGAAEQTLQIGLQGRLLKQAPPAAISTSTSRSLSGFASPRATDPETRTDRAP